MTTTSFYSSDNKSCFEVFLNTKHKIAFDIKDKDSMEDTLPLIDIEINDAILLVKILNQLIDQAK